jgi:hypothetical protein
MAIEILFSLPCVQITNTTITIWFNGFFGASTAKFTQNWWYLVLLNQSTVMVFKDKVLNVGQ